MTVGELIRELALQPFCTVVMLENDDGDLLHVDRIAEFRTVLNDEEEDVIAIVRVEE